MVRARRAALAAFVLLWSVAALALAAAPTAASLGAPAGGTPAVVWPPSTGLLIAEVVTGGTSASDEYVELTNAGPAPIDLNGLELAYASAAGTSAVRRATWSTATPLRSGRHLFIANAGGTYAAQADATYTAGIAATGGALILRPVGGTPIDAVGWGDATNAFIEAVPAPAPPAGSSIERRPGGSAGNVRDANNNAADWSVNPAPLPENLGAAPRPAPGSSPTPKPSPSPSPSPSPTARREPGPPLVRPWGPAAMRLPHPASRASTCGTSTPTTVSRSGSEASSPG